MRLFASRVFGVWAVVFVGLLGGCGNSPPAGEVRAEIEKAVVDGRPGVEARSIQLASWENKDMPGLFTTTWTAKLRFTEDHVLLLAVVHGKNVVRVVAKKGDELDMSGRATAAKPEGVRDWSCGAFADSGDESGWSKLAEKVGQVQMGYPVIGLDGSRTTKFRSGFVVSDFFVPISSLAPYVIEGSEEDKKLGDELAENARKAAEAQAARVKQQQEAQAARLKAQQEEYEARQAQLKAEAEERQRLATEKAEADRKQREEEAARRAEAARVARLTPVLAPFAGGKGAVVTTDGGQELGAFLYETSVDQENFRITGKGLDMREMPFKEFTFECVAADSNGRATFSFTRSDADAVALAPTAGGGLGARGVALTGLGDAERSRLDALSSLGRQLGSAAAAELRVEVLEAEPAKSRQMDLRTEGLPGTIYFRGRNSPNIGPLFTPAGTRGSAWKAEPLSIRLKEPARGTGLLIAGVQPTDSLLVVVNGVHRAKIDAIAKGGAAIIHLPPGMDVLDLRFEAIGSASARSIVMIK